MFKNILILLKIIDVKIIYKFLLLNFVYLINSLIQLTYIYSIFPLVSSITGYSNNFLSKLYNSKNSMNLSSFSDLEFSISVFIFVSILANISTMIMNYINFNFTYSTTTIIRSFFFKKISNNDYLKIISNSASFYTTILLSQVERFSSNTLGSIINIISQIFLILLISIPLLLTNFNLAAVLILFLIIVFLTLILFMKKLYSNYGKKISIYLESRNSLLLQLIKNFREIKIFNIQDQYKKNFVYNEKKLNNLYKFTSFVTHSTKPIIEIFLISIFAISSYFFLDLNNLDIEFFSKLSVLIFSFYKLAPAFNGLYSSFNTLSFDKDAINKLIEFSKKFKISNKENFTIKNIDSIDLKNINFAYNNENPVILKNININFKKNNIYLISGKSGSGKSTLLNILIGLLKTVNGSLLINKKNIPIYENENWFKTISYVSQNINLINDTLLNNITLGEKNIDKVKVKSILLDVGLMKDLNSRLNENIYENNLNISGGQLQRIGIARAIYRESELIIFDEPTSNLDTESEKKIIQILNLIKKDKIIIIVSHKQLNGINFTKHFNLKDGSIREI